MSQLPNVNVLEQNEIQKIIEQVKRYYYLFIISAFLAVVIAYFINRYSTPIFEVTSSILIKEDKSKQTSLNDYLNSNVFGSTSSLQNELEVMKSSTVLEETVKNLNLTVTYFTKRDFLYIDEYKNTPFKVMYHNNHVQPLHVKFQIRFLDNSNFIIKAQDENVRLWNFEKNELMGVKSEWQFERRGKINELIESPDMSFIVALDSQRISQINPDDIYYFRFNSVAFIVSNIKSHLSFYVSNREASLIQLEISSESASKGVDILNGVMNEYSRQNLDKKNYLASMTIDYINRQLGEISDSLNLTEQKLQRFRASNQIIDMGTKTTGLTQQYLELQNRMAELLTRKRYFDRMFIDLSKSDEIINVAIPSSFGIQDGELNRQVGDLLAAQAQKLSLIENKQEKNPLVKKLTTQINNLKNVISDNISTAQKTAEIEIDELRKRIGKIESEISSIPNTERQLIGIERKYRLNDAIFNYLMQKRAEANITKASNLPDNEILEPAKLESVALVYPNSKRNYLIAIFLGILAPFGFIQIRSFMNNKIEGQDSIERITNIPVLGKILHNNKKTNNVVYEYPSSNISESYRALRTNMDYYVRGGHKKVIMVTSSIEGEGKTFNALNIAMCYAQFGRKTIILNFDLRKRTFYFKQDNEDLIGMSSYLISKASIEDIIINSPHEKLDYIPAGPIPPNPVELIGLERTERLINQLKEVYDYIIIDTPPLAQVTDGYLLLEYADVKVLVARYNYTLKSVFTHVIKDLKMKNIENICIVLNDNRIFREQYGYGYGYNKAK